MIKCSLYKSDSFTLHSLEWLLFLKTSNKQKIISVGKGVEKLEFTKGNEKSPEGKEEKRIVSCLTGVSKRKKRAQCQMLLKCQVR